MEEMSFPNKTDMAYEALRMYPQCVEAYNILSNCYFKEEETIFI
jgi:hypothetical protein